jgi:hypothetical protein
MIWEKSQKYLNFNIATDWMFVVDRMIDFYFFYF